MLTNTIRDDDEYFFNLFATHGERTRNIEGLLPKLVNPPCN